MGVPSTSTPSTSPSPSASARATFCHAMPSRSSRSIVLARILTLAHCAHIGVRGDAGRLTGGTATMSTRGGWPTEGERMSLLAWLRRLAVSFGIGLTSYIIMLGIMVVSIVYDREAEPVISLAFDTGRSIVSAFDRLVSGSHWGQVAVNHLRERVNMTHVVLSIPAVLIASLIVGVPLNKW